MREIRHLNFAIFQTLNVDITPGQSGTPRRPGLFSGVCSKAAAESTNQSASGGSELPRGNAATSPPAAAMQFYPNRPQKSAEK
jgi:hypothetical protein